MNESTLAAEFRSSVEELHRYLCDEMAPMMVADSVLFLMEQPPELVAPRIQTWVRSQFSRGDTRYTTSDYIYHALKKIHLLSEFHLIDAERLRDFIQRLSPHLLEVCPEDEREKLRALLPHLSDSESATTSAPVERLYHAGGARPAAATGAPQAQAPGRPADDAVGRGLRRLSLLLDRLGSAGTVGIQGRATPEMEQVQMQALVTAAVQARSEAELQDHLRLLGGAGVDARSEQLFRMLSRTLPEWNVPVGPAAAGGSYASRSMEAMRKMVALAETPQEWARRFNDLVQAGIEQFNEGSLARSATMLDLAERMLSGKDVQTEVVQAIRRRAHEAIKEEQLRKYAERIEERPGLLRFMNFFPAMTIEGLLRQLHGETKRERRWLLLLLLEAHGMKARKAALEELEAFHRGDKTEPHGFHQRNLLYLLRRIPAGDGGPGDKEIEVIARLSKLENPPILIRESIRTLGPMRNPASERILLTRLKEFEATALKQPPPAPDGKQHPILDLLDSLCGALAAQRTESAASALVEHALREEPALGDAAARLDVLGSHDLSAYPEIVEVLLQTLRDRLPTKIFGVVIQKRERLPHLIRALAGTPLPAVKTALEEIAAKYGTQDLGAEAVKALEASKAAARRADAAPPGLSGDLQLFGLPNLFQSLSDSRVTGVLTLRKEHGQTCGTVQFREGKIEASEYTHLKGEDALYQLFEKPEARSFDFRAEHAPAGAAAANLTEVVPILLEAMRRHDELQQARALVPDGASLRTTQAKPKRLEDEEDLKLTQAVWAKAVTGSTPAQCEAVIEADAYRIRRLLAHWVEGGALQIAAAPSTAAAGTPAPGAAGAPSPATAGAPSPTPGKPSPAPAAK